MVFLDANHLIVVVIFRIILLVILVIGTEKEVGNELQFLFIVSLEVVFHELDIFRIIDTSEEFGIGAIAISSLLVAAAVLPGTTTVAILNTPLGIPPFLPGDITSLLCTLHCTLALTGQLVTRLSVSTVLSQSFTFQVIPLLSSEVIPPVDFCGLSQIGDTMCVM